MTHFASSRVHLNTPAVAGYFTLISTRATLFKGLWSRQQNWCGVDVRGCTAQWQIKMSLEQKEAAREQVRLLQAKSAKEVDENQPGRPYYNIIIWHRIPFPERQSCCFRWASNSWKFPSPPFPTAAGPSYKFAPPVSTQHFLSLRRSCTRCIRNKCAYYEIVYVSLKNYIIIRDRLLVTMTN